MNLWREGDQVGQEVEEWQSMVPHPEFDKIIKLYRWKEFRTFLPYAFQSQKLKDLIIIVLIESKSLPGFALMNQ